MNDKIYNLSDLGKLVEETIESSIGYTYFWVVAEISSINVRRGHCYLSLVEKSIGSAFPKAEMKGIIWSNIYDKLNQSFKNATGFDLKQDISILFLTRINYSVRYGLSLYIYDVKAEYTLGNMMLDKQKTIEELKKKGIFHLNKTVEIPLVPQKIAVLSAIDSKGFEDFMSVLKNNQYGYGFNVHLFSVVLQGNKAAETIAEQLEYIGQNKDKYDIIAIVRGGGGNVDLQCYNSYTLSEAVALSPLPIITGIGHTTDISVTDEVACIHKETPTAVAQHIIQMMQQYELSIIKQYEKIIRYSERTIFEEWNVLEKHLKTIQYTPKLILKQKKHSLEYLSQNIFSLSRSNISEHKTFLRYTKENLKQNSKHFIRSQNSLLQHKILSLRFSKHIVLNEKEKFDNILSNAMKITKSKILSEKQYLSHANSRAELFKPELMLKKGYAIVRYQGKILKSIKQAELGTSIEVQLSDGTVQSQVKSKTN